jgi:hypothetical protein
MKNIAAGLAAGLAALALAFWAYSVLKQRELVENVVALVGDTSAELKEAISLEATSSLAGTPEAVRRLERYARSADVRLQELEAMETWRDPELGDAARSYIGAARQLLANQVASHRHRSLFQESAETLREHMQGASRRTDGWIQEAVRRKQQVDRAYVDYRYSVENFGRLLGDYSDARSGLATRVDDGLLVDDSLVTEARERVLEAGKRAAAEMAKARQFAAPR